MQIIIKTLSLIIASLILSFIFSTSLSREPKKITRIAASQEYLEIEKIIEQSDFTKNDLKRFLRMQSNSAPSRKHIAFLATLVLSSVILGVYTVIKTLLLSAVKKKISNKSKHSIAGSARSE
jgi:butyrate kinase